jgi:hypothetical protein
MAIENRKALRREIRHVGVIVHADGKVRLPCTLRDVSATGALIEVEVPADVPDSFVLLLSANGRARRRCAVVRRTKEAVGVVFHIDGEKPAG